MTTPPLTPLELIDLALARAKRHMNHATIFPCKASHRLEWAAEAFALAAEMTERMASEAWELEQDSETKKQTNQERTEPK